MAKYEMFSVYDSKSQLYGFPFFQSNVEIGKRVFSDLAANPETLISRHPHDFSLYHIGSYDDATAVCEMATPRTHVCTAIEVLSARERVRVGNGKDDIADQSQYATTDVSQFSKAKNEGIV